MLIAQINSSFFLSISVFFCNIKSFACFPQCWLGDIHFKQNYFEVQNSAVFLCTNPISDDDHLSHLISSFSTLVGIDIHVPYFNGMSYVQYIGLRRTVLSFAEIEVVFKADEANGLILYNGYTQIEVETLYHWL